MNKRVEIEVDCGVFDSAVNADEIVLIQKDSPYRLLFYAADESERGTGMHLDNVRDIPKFFEIVKECKGRVELVTNEGDRLNLKSKLCQYFALADVFANGDVDGLELLCSNPEDIGRFLIYMTKGE